MRTALLRLSSWLLVGCAFVLYLLAPNANGPVLVLAWGAIVAVFRFGATALVDRGARVVADTVFIVVCLVAAFEGGWFLVPAALAFLARDLTDNTPRPVQQPSS